MRLTKHRSAILELLEKRHETMSAQSIQTALPNINLVTIYRALEALVKAGLVKKLHLSSSEAVYEIADSGHQHAVCADCDRVVHLDMKEAEQLKKLLKIPNFTVTDIEVVVKGHCAKNHRP